MPVKHFDADKLAKQRADMTITIGARIFHPRKRSVALMKEWADAAPEAAGLREIPEDKPLEAFESITKQLNVLLRDEEGEEPGVEFLDEELDIEEGFTLLNTLSPQLGIESRLGNSEAVVATTGT